MCVTSEVLLARHALQMWQKNLLETSDWSAMVRARLVSIPRLDDPVAPAAANCQHRQYRHRWDDVRWNGNQTLHQYTDRGEDNSPGLWTIWTTVMRCATASLMHWHAVCRQFRTLPPGSWWTPGDVIISRLYSASCTGFLCFDCNTHLPVLVRQRHGYLADDCQLSDNCVLPTLEHSLCSSFTDRTFPAAGPQVWNSLPPNLRLCGLSYGQFRRLLKTFLFGQWGYSAAWTVFNCTE